MTGTPRSGYRPLDAPRRGPQLPSSYVQRAGAVLLDAVVMVVMVPTPVAVVFLVTGRPLNTCTWSGGIESCAMSPENARLSRILFWCFAAVFVVFHSWMTSTRRTWGQRAAGVEIVDDATGARVTFGRSLIRTIAMVPSALALGLGFWWAFWDRRRRTWHDIVARTRSVSP